MSSKTPTNLTASIAAKIKNWRDSNSQSYVYKIAFSYTYHKFSCKFLDDLQVD